MLHAYYKVENPLNLTFQSSPLILIMVLYLKELLFLAIIGQTAKISHREIWLNHQSTLPLSKQFKGLVINSAENSISFWSEENLVTLCHFQGSIEEVIHSLMVLVSNFKS